eukprot:gb/GFBE01077879.1/.p1 GENE.gb/GFBE01077879.1/~~gb/GFBE01077879.1/.p1  ORF type:complete len:245 (+),score=55.20 gb/GFBE01077879.1/:1-735(+)
MSLLFVAILAVTAQLATSASEERAAPRRLTTSTQCRTSLDLMLKDPNWKYVNNSMTRWCRLRLENKMASCCGLANFAEGKAEGCNEEECVAECLHQNMITLCNDDFGESCIIDRKPFFKTGAPAVTVRESFCVPQDCNNAADREALVAWFAALYVGRRNGWHLDYDEARLACAGSTVTVLIGIVTAIVIIASLIPLSIFLFKAPKQAGQTLISQSEMQESAKQDEDEDMLRATGMGSDDAGMMR